VLALDDGGRQVKPSVFGGSDGLEQPPVQLGAAGIVGDGGAPGHDGILEPSGGGGFFRGAAERPRLKKVEAADADGGGDPGGRGGDHLEDHGQEQHAQQSQADQGEPKGHGIEEELDQRRVGEAGADLAADIPLGEFRLEPVAERTAHQG